MGEKWLVTRDGEPGMSYVSQEAALRTGHEVRIEVAGSAYDRAGDRSQRAVVENPSRK